MADKPSDDTTDSKITLAQERAKQMGAEHGRVVNQPRAEISAQEEYLYGRGVFSTYKNQHNWASHTRGRMMIRLVSRGIFGAFAFAIANRYASSQLRNYEPETFKWGQSNFLQHVAYSFDMTAGKAIQGFVGLIQPKGSYWSREVVRFRPKSYFHSIEGQPVGRSLGAEIVNVTFDFSAMSWFDGAARNIIQALDPNMVQPWFRDKNDNPTIAKEGTFSPWHWAKAVGHSTWRITTKNAGEDWFVALPYVYYMKWQRQAIAKFFPDFKLSSDRNRNGGNLLLRPVEKDGQIVDTEIVGDLNLPGAIDLQGRFVMYNVLTLMYREMYDGIGRAILRAYHNGFRMQFSLPSNPITAAVDGIGYTGRYLLKSFVKANLFMQPSVPFFWVFRTPQSRWKSEMLMQGANPNQNAIATWKPMRDAVLDPEGRPRFDYPMTYDDFVRPTGGVHGGDRPDHVYFGKQRMPFPSSLKKAGPYAWENCKTLTSKLLNPFGWISYTTGTGLVRAVDALLPLHNSWSYWLAGVGQGTADRKIRLERAVLLRNYVDAAYSYTPYFIAKDEFGLRVNDSPSSGEPGKMDKAIYGLIDNVFTFRFNKAEKSLKEIYKLAVDLPGHVNYQEGKHILPEEEYKNSQKPTTSSKQTVDLAITPSSKVQAVTVQYNAPPPTHLKHDDSEKRAQKPWAESISSRSDSPTPSTTLH